MDRQLYVNVLYTTIKQSNHQTILLYYLKTLHLVIFFIQSFTHLLIENLLESSSYLLTS